MSHLKDVALKDVGVVGQHFTSSMGKADYFLFVQTHRPNRLSKGALWFPCAGGDIQCTAYRQKRMRLCSSLSTRYPTLTSQLVSCYCQPFN